MHDPVNVILPRLFMSRNVRPSIFRPVGLSIVSEETKFIATVRDYGTFWFHCNKLVVLKRTGVGTTWKLKHL
jgi:hypothetical protein